MEQATASRESKPTRLMGSIRQMNNVSKRICILLDKIRDGHSPADGLGINKASQVDAPEPIPSIQQCLNDGVDTLEGQYAEMMSYLDQVESELF
jgi:hypothetical protein